MNKKTLYTIIGILLIVLFWRGCANNATLQEKIGLYEALADTLKTTRNKNGQQTAKISLLQSSNKKAFLTIKSNDTTIIKLQAIVSQYKGKLASATILGNETRETGTTVSTVLGGDTVIVGDTVKIFAIYTSNWDEPWSIGSITASRDSIIRNIKVKNEYEITQGLEKQKGLFKKKKPTVSIKNLNPNTTTTELRTFQIKIPPKRFAVMGGLFIGHDGKIYLGGGVGFKLFQF